MSYSCSDFTDSILEALEIAVPPESADSPSDQAGMALAKIAAMNEVVAAARDLLDNWQKNLTPYAQRLSEAVNEL